MSPARITMLAGMMAGLPAAAAAPSAGGVPNAANAPVRGRGGARAFDGTGHADQRLASDGNVYFETGYITLRLRSELADWGTAIGVLPA
jgi:hypothetical protein